jgi:hypothetical protein
MQHLGLFDTFYEAQRSREDLLMEVVGLGAPHEEGLGGCVVAIKSRTERWRSCFQFLYF